MFFCLHWLLVVRSHFWPFTGVQNGNQREVMRKGGFAALSRYGGATTDSADFTDQVLNRRKQRHEDYGPFVAIHRTALYSLRYLLFERFVRGALPFDFAQGKLGGALLDPCYQCNPWLIAFRREGGDDFFETRLSPCKRIFPDLGNPG